MDSLRHRSCVPVKFCLYNCANTTLQKHKTGASRNIRLALLVLRTAIATHEQYGKYARSCWILQVQHTLSCGMCRAYTPSYTVMWNVIQYNVHCHVECHTLQCTLSCGMSYSTMYTVMWHVRQYNVHCHVECHTVQCTVSCGMSYSTM